MIKIVVKPLIIIHAIFFLGIFGFANISEAASHYVRSDATGSGDGSNWTNAYASLPSSLTRGDTYYIADGSYGSYTYDDNTSGNSLVTIKKAIPSDHGTDSGWQDSYGDGQAEFSSWVINMSYIVIDGNSDNWRYGISVIKRGGGHGIQIGQSASVSNVTVRGVTVDMSGATSGVEYRGFYLSSGSYSKSDILLENVEVHHSEGDCLTADRTNYIIIDHFYCRDRRNIGQGVHGDAFELWGVDNATFRYSKIDWNGQQIFFAGSGSYVGFKVYGNMFYGGATAGKGMIIKSAPVEILIYNNVFQGLNMGLSGFSSTTSGDAKNNIFYNINSISWGGVTHSYNASNGLGLGGANDITLRSNPFVAIGSNFHLVAPLSSAGNDSLDSAYSTDADGMNRGLDGVWDRGAYEFIDDGIARPSAPLNLTVSFN